MPVQPSDNSSGRITKPMPDRFGKKPPVKEKPSDQRADDVQTNYGFGQNADMDTAAEETEEQEYAANGLPRTQTYSVDRVGRSHDHDGRDFEKQSNRKNRSDCGC